MLRRGVHQDQQYYLKEHAIEFPGVQLADTYLRSYPYKSLLAQVLGYVGPITAAELKTAEKNHYQPQDVMGQAGIEQTYDRYLRGTDGRTSSPSTRSVAPRARSRAGCFPNPGTRSG